MQVNKCHSCQEELSSGEDKAHVAGATVAVDALQCDPEAQEAKGTCQLTLMDILHLLVWLGFSIWYQPRLVQRNEYPEIQI